MCCWEGTPEACVGVWRWPDCARLCPAPTQTAQEKAQLQVQELLGDTWPVPPQGWEPISSPQPAWVHLQVPRGARCGATPPPERSRNKTPALGADSGSFHPPWAMPSPGWRELLARTVCGFTALRPCGHCDLSSLCPPRCLTHSGSLEFPAHFPSQGHQFSLSWVRNESAVLKDDKAPMG